MKRWVCFGAAFVMSLSLAERVHAADQKIEGVSSIAMAPSIASPLSNGKREFLVEASGSSDGVPLRGTVQVEGSDNFSGGQMGQVKWVIDGTAVNGRLVRNGYVAGSFRGTLTDGGAASGVFMMSDGTVVQWIWTPEGPAKDNGSSDQGVDASAP